MSSGSTFGFGFGPIPSADPDNVRRVLRRAPFDPSQGAPVTLAEGASGVATTEGETQALERQTSMVPPATAGIVSELFSREPTGAPQRFTGSTGVSLPSDTVDVPLPPQRPANLGADMIGTTGSVRRGPLPGPMPASTASPAPYGAPTMSGPPAAPPPAPAAEASFADSFGEGLRRFKDNGGFDLAGSIGRGLLSAPTWGEGVATGLALDDRRTERKAATDLARSEHALRVRKLGQEQRQLTGNATYVKRKLEEQGQKISDDEALSLGGNAAFMNELFKGSLPPSELYRQHTDPASGNEYNINSRTGQKTLIATGKSPDGFTLGEGQTRFDQDGKVVAATAPKRPDGFDVEGKLRGEFAKGLGTFQDVHDGFGRVIASTEQRATNPKGVSPASDIGLIFGYMKMLDPGSVVREGEYATAKNAAGLDDRLRNTYNRLLSGEFLTAEQRQDFLEQAERLYGKARTTADQVAGRYRNLAGQYGVDPDRTAYLPPALVAPKVGASRMEGAPGKPSSSQPVPPKGGPNLRFQQLTRGGMSKEQAFQKMREEGF